MKYLNFIDTETTGFNPGEDRMVELAVVRVEQDGADHRIVKEKLWRFNPCRSMPEGAFKVHGLSSDYLANFPTFAEKAKEIIQDMHFLATEGELFIAHNAPFDKSFIEAELRMSGHRIEIPFTDSLARAKIMFPTGRNNLDALAARLEVDTSNRHLHGALIDAAILADAWKRMDDCDTRSQKFDLSSRRPDIVAESATIFDRPQLRRLGVNAEDTGRHQKGIETMKGSLWAKQDDRKAEENLALPIPRPI